MTMTEWYSLSGVDEEDPHQVQWMESVMKKMTNIENMVVSIGHVQDEQNKNYKALMERIQVSSDSDRIFDQVKGVQDTSEKHLSLLCETGSDVKAQLKTMQESISYLQHTQQNLQVQIGCLPSTLMIVIWQQSNNLIYPVKNIEEELAKVLRIVEEQADDVASLRNATQTMIHSVDGASETMNTTSKHCEWFRKHTTQFDSALQSLKKDMSVWSSRSQMEELSRLKDTMQRIGASVDAVYQKADHNHLICQKVASQVQQLELTSAVWMREGTPPRKTVSFGPDVSCSHCGKS